MHADLDLLLSTVFVTADDLLPERQNNAARWVTGAEVVTLCAAQAIAGIPSVRRFLAVARKRPGHMFPELPERSGYFKRRRRLAVTLEWLMGVSASHSPGFHDDLLLIDSTLSRETAKRSAVGDAAGYGWCASHSRYFWGLRLHAIFAPDGTPRALALRSPNADEREIGLILPDRCQRRGGEVLLGDGGHASHGFAAQLTERDATGPRTRHKNERGTRPHLPPIRQRIESIFRTRKDLLTLEPPPRPHTRRPQRTRPRTHLPPRRRDHPQPPTRTQQPCTRQLQRLTARNQPSRVGAAAGHGRPAELVPRMPPKAASNAD
jgi:hypothetical protein